MNGVRTDARRTGRRGFDGVSSDLTAIGCAVIEGKDISVVKYNNYYSRVARLRARVDFGLVCPCRVSSGASAGSGRDDTLVVDRHPCGMDSVPANSAVQRRRRGCASRLWVGRWRSLEVVRRLVWHPAHAQGLPGM